MFGHIYPSKLMVSMLLAGALAGGRAEQFAGSTRCMDRPASCMGWQLLSWTQPPYSQRSNFAMLAHTMLHRSCLVTTAAAFFFLSTDTDEAFEKKNMHCSSAGVIVQAWNCTKTGVWPPEEDWPVSEQHIMPACQAQICLLCSRAYVLVDCRWAASSS